MDEQGTILPGDATPTLRNNVSITVSDSSIGNFYAQCNVTVKPPKADSEPQAKDTQLKKSINNFRQPPNGFVACTTATDVEEKLKRNQSLVLHLHGFPGTGKSTIARKLAADYPFNKKEETAFIKYLIECSDSSEYIGESLKKLVNQMWERNLVLNKSSCDRACEQLETKRTVGFVELLVEAEIPVVIVIEDPPNKQLQILNDLLSSLHHTISRQATKNKDVHLCITSQSKNICKFPCEQYCKRVQVNGLTDEEGLKLLGISCDNSTIERDAAFTLIRDLHGSPLGLIVVRATCRKSRLSYEEYGNLRNVSYHKEREHFREDVGPHTKHLYEAIVTLLDEKGLWNTMKVLSFFHHGNIPQRLIGLVKLRQKVDNDRPSVRTFHKKKQESGKFISRLEDFAICDVNGDKYEETTITLHQVVFDSVQIYMTDQLSALRDAIFALASLVQRGYRSQSKHEFVLSMIPHILSVIQFADSHPQVCNDFVTSMAVVHLRKIYGSTAKHFDSVAAERSLMECARTIWNEISKRCEMQRDLDDLLNETNIPVTETVTPILEACLAAGEQLRSEKNLLDQYTCVITQFKPGDHDGLSNFSIQPEVIERLKLISNYSLQLTPDELTYFRSFGKGKLFLDVEKHCQVFFIDQLVSALYCLARVAQYDHHVTELEKSKFVRISDLAYALCDRCRQCTGVNLICLHLSAVCRVSVRLRNFSKIDAKSKRDVLNDAINVVQKNLNNLSKDVDIPFYENGLKSTMEENAYDELLNLRAIIRIHTKLLPLCSDEEEAKLVKQRADQFYERLCEQARTNIERWSVSAKCLVYCGKYMASLGNYREAIEHFQKVLTCKAVVDDNRGLFPWVCYNFARATVAGKWSLNIQPSLNKAREALKYERDIPVDLANKLKEQVNRLTDFER